MVRKARKQKAQLTDEELKQKKIEAETRAALESCRCGKAKDFEPNTFRVKEIPEQRLRDKLGHDLALNIMSSWTDEKQKTVNLRFVVSDTPYVKTMTFAEVCEHFGWKSFKLSPNKQTVIPKW